MDIIVMSLFDENGGKNGTLIREKSGCLKKVFLDSITTINIHDIRTHVDRSLGFWEKVIELIDTTLFTELPEEEYNRTLTTINIFREI